MRFLLAFALLALAACATTPRETPLPMDALLALPVDSSRTYDESQVEQKPRLSNPAILQRALERGYPAHLRDAGISGDVTLQFVIDEAGVPRRVRVVRGSGYADFDASAVAVMSAARFTPARLRGHRVRVISTIPLTFRAM
jgi:protein TonB